jgi:hypothetical protein
MIVALSAIGKTTALSDSSTDQAQQRQSNCCRINQSSSDERWMRGYQVCRVLTGKKLMFRGADSWQFLELVRQLPQQRQNGPKK